MDVVALVVVHSECPLLAPNLSLGSGTSFFTSLFNSLCNVPFPGYLGNSTNFSEFINSGPLWCVYKHLVCMVL